MSRKPLIIVVALTVVALLAAAAPLAVVRARRPTSGPCHAAIALRDRVPFEQMLGTRLFTMPWLLAGYEHVTYIEATEDDDGRPRLLAALEDARADGCEVDLLFLAHGDAFSAWVEAVPERPRIGLVYDTGAGDARQGARWLDVGARAFVGHPGANLAPIFYAFFLPTWLGGATVEDAVASSNANTFLAIDAMRPSLGDETERLWLGTRAVVFGDARLSR